MEKQFWQYEDIDADTAHLRFYGDVCSETPVDWWTGEPISGEFITPEGLKNDLEQAQGKKVLNITINSGGGDAYVGLAIANVLSGLSAKKVVTIDGIAASAAATIACSADVLKMYPGSLLMIHNAKIGVMDMCEQSDLKKFQRNLEAIESASAAIYAKKSGQTETAIRAQMDRETWFTGAEAKDAGFCDEIIGDDKAVDFAMKSGRMVVNGVGINPNLFADPNRLREFFPKTKATKAAQKQTQKEVQKMDIETLKKEYPELVSAIAEESAANAIKMERSRIQSIEEIANSVNDTAMVNEAKFGETACTAEALAFRAMQSASKLGKKFLTERDAEMAPASNVATTTPALIEDPNAIAQMQAQADDAIIASAVKAVNSIKR